MVGGCETGGITAWNQTTGIVKNCYVSGSITTLSNNSGLIGGYGYTGTVYQGNVVLSGSMWLWVTKGFLWPIPFG